MRKSILKDNNGKDLPIMRERLDKILSSQGVATRREAQKLIRSGQVKVDGEIVRDPGSKTNIEVSIVSLRGADINYRRHLYIMLNKPAGLLCVSRDPKAPTVMDLLPETLKRPGLFPAGRLDKDTVGLVIITDDGDFAHRMLAPRKEIFKQYHAILDAPVGEREAAIFETGAVLEDGTRCRSAKLRVLDEGEKPRVAVFITEGRYHQIKRMFGSVDRKVLWLKRVSIGRLCLDPTLGEEKCRELTNEERNMLFENPENFCEN